MIEDINYFKQNGCDGIVFGCLNSENQIDKKNCRKVLNAWGSSPVTFHRAFDETSKDDIEENLKILVDLGFNRILSSGYEPSAEQGIRNLKKMVQLSKNMPIEILSGSGINSLNVKKIIEETGCSEIHCSARSELNDSKTGKLQMGGSQDSQPLMVCDPLKVYEIIQILKTF